MCKKLKKNKCELSIYIAIWQQHIIEQGVYSIQSGLHIMEHELEMQFMDCSWDCETHHVDSCQKSTNDDMFLKYAIENLLCDKKINPKDGSVPIEKIQNLLMNNNKEL